MHPNRAVSPNAQRFCVTHPFHPSFGRKFELIAWRQSWGEDRVYFHDAAGRLCSFPASFTSLGPPDPFVMTAAGRSCFRVQDLVELSKLVEGLRSC
jgi:hypothetical protein